MLFKFKSKATADLIMLDVDARRLLKIMLGDDPVKGILRWQDLPAVRVKIDAALLHDESLRQASSVKAKPTALLETEKPHEPELPAVRLAQRAAPMQQMIRRSIAEESDIVWGL
jgi:hypothetical protein